MHQLARWSAVAVLLATVSCSDPVTPSASSFPPPDGPVGKLLIKRVTSYLVSQPGEQMSEFTYDEQNRLVGYEFGLLVNGELRPTIRKEFLYRDDGLPLGHDRYLRLEDGTWLLQAIARYGYDVDSGLAVEVHQEEIEENGTVVVSTIGLGYDEFGRIIEVRDGPETLSFTYDRNGDVHIVRHDDIRFGVQVLTLEHGEPWNPFVDFPPLHGTHTGIIGPDHTSLHLSTRYENAVEGESPAAIGTATIIMNELGYPVRREYTAWNTAEPDVQTVAVTEYEYVLPSGS